VRYYRRAASVFAEWSAEGFEVVSPKDGRTRLKVGCGVVNLVTSLSEWTESALLVERLRDQVPAVTIESVLRELVSQGVVDCRREHPSVVSDHQEPVDHMSDWGPIAALYHLHGRDAPYLINEDRKREYTNYITRYAAPAIAKTYDDKDRILLSRSLVSLDIPFGRVLAMRRTHRYFTADAVSLDELSTLLQLTFGPQVFIDGKVFGTLQFRTSPNAGARQEIECYVVALNVSDVSVGIYHYNSMEHSLELLGREISRSKVQNLLYEQPMANTAPVLILTSAVTERIAYKYRDGRAYRLWMYNIGHVGQTFALISTALGLGAFQTAAFRDSPADRLLGLDGKNEFVTYVLGCGRVEHLEWPSDVARADVTDGRKCLSFDVNQRGSSE